MSILRTTILTLASVGVAAASLAAGGLDMACEAEQHCRFPRWDPAGTAMFDQVGFEVRVTDDVALVAAPGALSVYVYRSVYGAWQHVDTLQPPPGSSAQGFGKAMALTADRAVIAAPRDDSDGVDAGAVFLYDRVAEDEWSYSSTLLSNTPEPGSYFGNAVAAALGRLAIGQPGTTGGGTLHVYRPDGAGWDVVSLPKPGPNTYGDALDMVGQLLVVGDRFDDTMGTNAGAAHVYRVSSDGMVSVGTLIAFDGAAGDLYGATVATNGSAIAIGSPFDDDVGSASGSVYLYEYSWGADIVEYDGKLTACDADTNAFFGSALAIDGGFLVAGAPGADTAYVFLAFDGSWVPYSHLTPGDQPGWASFGGAVDIQGPYPLIGAPTATGVDGTGNAGGVYRYSLANASLAGAPCPCDTDAAAVQYGAGKAGFGGVAPDLVCIDPPVLGEKTYLRVWDAPQGQAILLFGVMPAAIPFDGGMVYVAGPILLPLGPVGEIGSMSINYALPVSPVLCDTLLAHQVIVLDPAAAGPVGTAQTNGLLLIPGS